MAKLLRATGPIEEATAFQDLAQAYGATQEELAAMLGKSRSTVANALRLLTLEESIRNMLRDNKLTRGHAKALLGLEPGPERERLAKLCVARGLSVREIERRVHLAATGPARERRRRGRRRAARVAESPAMREFRLRAERALSTPVAIEQDGRGPTGTISIKYFDSNDLERLLALLGVDVDLS